MEGKRLRQFERESIFSERVGALNQHNSSLSDLADELVITGITEDIETHLTELEKISFNLYQCIRLDIRLNAVHLKNINTEEKELELQRIQVFKDSVEKIYLPTKPSTGPDDLEKDVTKIIEALTRLVKNYP